VTTLFTIHFISLSSTEANEMRSMCYNSKYSTTNYKCESCVELLADLIVSAPLISQVSYV
jgi:hypothetical protein